MKGFFGWFGKRAEPPIESRDYGKVYFVLSALLFIGTMWAVYDEVSSRRPWKETQLAYMKLSQIKWEDKLKEAQAAGCDVRVLESRGVVFAGGPQARARLRSAREQRLELVRLLRERPAEALGESQLDRPLETQCEGELDLPRPGQSLVL